MSAIAKVIGGVVLVVASLYYMIAGIPGIIGPAWRDFLTVLNGFIPPLLILIGIFVIWLEADELKMEKWTKKEERKTKKKKK